MLLLAVFSLPFRFVSQCGVSLKNNFFSAKKGKLNSYTCPAKIWSWNKYRIDSFVSTAKWVECFLATNIRMYDNCLSFNETEINPLNPELNRVCYLLALLGAHHFLHVSRIRVKLLTFRLLMSYMYIWSTHSWCF